MASEPSKITHRMEDITPRKAMLYLATMKRKRIPRSPKMAGMVRDLKSGRWKYDGATIVFDEDGNLIDGQHRLQAVIDAGIAATMLVVRGVSKEAWRTIDSGTARSLGDVLRMEGYLSSSCLSATLRRTWSWIVNGPPFGPRVNLGLGASVLEAMYVLAACPTMPTSITAARSAGDVVPPSHAAFLHFMAAEDPVASIDEFYVNLVKGEGLDHGDPALVLRERMLRNRADRATKLTSVMMFGFLIKAWNAFRDGVPIVRGHLRLSMVGRSPEGFPVIASSPRPELVQLRDELMGEETEVE